MPTTSAAFRQGRFAARSSDTLRALLTIAHPDLATVRLVDDVFTPLRSNGQSFENGRRFDATLPIDDDRAPRGEIVIDDRFGNLGRSLIALDSPPTARIQMVLASAPDTVEVDFGALEMRDLVATRVQVSATLGLPDLARESFPEHSFTPEFAPGVF
ncbi:MAG: hypothetical protein OXE76_04040 [Alphaproteobacteria bacterium]|nr:hypothetical protein [Alphaproteobacteria bacterium]